MDKYEIINGKKYKICPDGKIRNMKTMRCIKLKPEKKPKVKKEKSPKVKKEKSPKVKKEKSPKVKPELKFDYPLEYKFNKTNVKKFLDECNKPFLNPDNNKIEELDTYDIAKRIIENTEHISFKKFISLLEDNIDDMITQLEKDRPLFINTGNKKKSYWLFKYVIDYININYPNIHIILLKSPVIENEKIIDNDLIVYIDESMFGFNMNTYIANSLNITDCKLRFFILSSFCSKNKLESIRKNFNISLYGNKLIFNKTIIYSKNIRDIISNKEMEYIGNIYKYLGDAFYKDLIYFDHNLGDKINTFIPFYSGIVPNAENSYYIKKKNLDKLKIIPLLTNCEHITTYDTKKILCPKTL
jgi:hypothetical protein